MQTSLQLPILPSGYVPKSLPIIDPTWLFKSRNPQVILPVVFACLGEHGTREGLLGSCKLWCLLRSLDNPLNGSTGRGIVEIAIKDVAWTLDCSYRTIYRYLQSGKDRGFFRYWHCKLGHLKVVYSSPTSIALKHKLNQLGAVVEAPALRLGHLRTVAIEGGIEQKQAQSYVAHKKHWGKFSKGALQATELLKQPCDKAARVLCRGKRLLYLAPHWRPFGASQIGIASSLGLSERTIQYHTCHSWREVREIPKLNKAQAAHQINEDCPKSFNKLLYESHPEKQDRWVFLGSRMFEILTNLYDTPIHLRPYRYRKAFYRDRDYPTKFFPDLDLEEYQRMIRDHQKQKANELKQNRYRPGASPAK